MSIQSRRDEEKQARIEMIKKSAWKIFLKDPFDKAKISDIAKDCRLGLSTLYYYFKDKRQIVYSLMLDFKVDNNRQLFDLLSEEITFREFLKGYVAVHLKDMDRFRFFVLADSYYNYHMQYDLTDPILESYDKITRKEGNHLLSCLSRGLDAKGSRKLRIALFMILGFLRRYVLVPQNSWPKNKEDTELMFIELEELILALFEDAGVDLDSVIRTQG